MLDQYLSQLTQDDDKQKTASAHYETLSVVDLAKQAGIELPENICTSCISEMKKLGSIYRCSCGMMKKAALPAALIKPVKKPEAQAGSPTAGEEAEGEMAKAASKSLTKLQPHPSMSKDKDAPYGYLAQAEPGWHEGKSSDTGKPSMDKEAFNPLQAVKNIGQLVASKPGREAITTGAKGLASRGAAGAKGLGESIKKTYQGARAGAPQIGEAGKGVGGALLQTAKKHPGAAAGAAGVAGLGAGYAMGKTSSIIEAGETAGKLLAKIAFDNTPIPIEELRESLEEAKSREDVQGRGQRSAVTGGILGGLAGGGAGAAAGKKLFGTPGMIAGGLMGAGGAGGAGAYFGKGYGQEEARADKALSLLRAMRAHQSGAGMGYRAGMQRGYGMSQQGSGE